MTVPPPPVIAANRALLMMLVANNFLGQSASAIAATEASASAAAPALTPFTPAGADQQTEWTGGPTRRARTSRRYLGVGCGTVACDAAPADHHGTHGAAGTRVAVESVVLVVNGVGSLVDEFSADGDLAGTGGADGDDSGDVHRLRPRTQEHRKHAEDLSKPPAALSGLGPSGLSALGARAVRNRP
jgi:PPE family